MATGVQISSFQYVGNPALNAVFGFFKTSSGVQVQRLQIAAQTPPVGGNIVIQLVDQSGNEYAGATITLPSGTSYLDQPLAAPLSLGLSKIIRAKVTGVDTGVAADITLNLIGATAQGATAPSGCGPSNCQPPQGQVLFFQGNVQLQVEQAQAAANAAETSAEAAATSATAAAASATAAEAAKDDAESEASDAAASAAAAAGSASAAATSAGAAATSAGNSASSASAAAVSASAAAAYAAEAQAGAKAATLQLTPGSTQTIPDATATAVQWNNAQFDDWVFWDASNPTRLTVPAGRNIARVRLTAGIRWTPNAAGIRKIQIRANPVGLYAANTIVASLEVPSDVDGDIQCISPILTVEAGMYFEVLVTQTSGGGLDIFTTAPGNVANFFSLEVMGITP